jgi:hypothetical protein
VHLTGGFEDQRDVMAVLGLLREQGLSWDAIAGMDPGKMDEVLARFD